MSVTTWQPKLNGAEPVYLDLVSALEADLARGRLKPGDRLPPQRRLARDLSLALGTVTRAYAEAESRGLAYGVVGRGTFAGRKPASDRFGTPAGDAVDLALAWPLYGLDPDLAAALREVASSGDAQRLLEYSPHTGHLHHREAGRAWAAQQGIVVAVDRVVVCAGAQHALNVALCTLLAPGDALLTEPVTYPGLRALAAALRVRLVGVPMDDEGIIPEAFESACVTRRPRALYSIPTIQNPTAAVMGEARREAIARIARRHDVAIIEDEVHRLLHPDPPPAFATLAPDITYTVLSLSKVVTGGLRVAFLIVPPERVEHIDHLVWATTWMAPPLTVEIAARWIRDGTAAATAVRKREEAAARQDIAREVLAGVPYRTASHAYHLWVPLPSHWRATGLVLECARRGVAISAAESFAVSRDPFDDAVRLSLSGPATREELRQGLRTVAAVLDSPVSSSAVL